MQRGLNSNVELTLEGLIWLHSLLLAVIQIVVHSLLKCRLKFGRSLGLIIDEVPDVQQLPKKNILLGLPSSQVKCQAGQSLHPEELPRIPKHT